MKQIRTIHGRNH